MQKKIKILFLLTLKRIKKFRFKKTYLVFLFFLLLSTIFWFLNALNKEYNSFIEVPLRLKNTSKNQIPANQKDSIHILTVKVNSRGFKILNHNISFFKKKFTLTSGSKYIKQSNDSLELVLKTSLLKNRISAHLGEAFKILEIQPDSIVFAYEYTETKKVPIIPNIDIKFKTQFYQPNSIKLSPDSIIVSATKDIIDTITRIETQAYEFVNVDNTLNFDCELKKLDKVKFTQNSIKVKVPVEEFTEKKLQIPIEIENLPKNLDLLLFPQKVNVKFNVAVSKYLKVKSEDILFTVNYNDISSNTKNLKLVLKTCPDYIFDLAFNPKKVEFIVEK